MHFPDTHDADFPDAREVAVPIQVDLAFDFRSPRFEEAALQLAAWSARPLDDCRRELFLAEGDMDEARAVLDHGHCLQGVGRLLQ